MLLQFIFNLIRSFYKKVPIKIPKPIESVPPVVQEFSPRERLYIIAKACLGTDASPKDIASDDLACAESVNDIYYKAFGRYIDEPGLSTTKLYEMMKSKPELFELNITSLEGDIIISPTGYGNGIIAHGHTGIVGKFGIMSNDSNTGLWRENYTIERWDEYFQKKGGFPVYFFRPI